MNKISNPIGRTLGRFRRDESGTSAVEFAIIMPLFLLPAWFGMAEIAVMQERTTTLNTTTAMVADMVSQYQSPTEANLQEIMTTATYVLGDDANSTKFGMTVMGVVVPADDGNPSTNDDPYVSWYMHHKGTGPDMCGVEPKLPASVAIPTLSDRTVIVADGGLDYESPFSWGGKATKTKDIVIEEKMLTRVIESEDKQLKKEVVSKDERLTEVVEVNVDGEVIRTYEVAVGRGSEILHEVKVGRGTKKVHEVRLGKEQTITKKVKSFDNYKATPRQLSHRSIYAPRRTANPMGPNPCTPPT